SLCPPPSSSSSPPLPSRLAPGALTVLAETSPPGANGSSAAPPDGRPSAAPGVAWAPSAAPPCGSGFLQWSACTGPGRAAVPTSAGTGCAAPGRAAAAPCCPWRLRTAPAGGWGGEEGRGTLTLLSLSHDHSGLYFCRVEAGGALGRSCGTFVRVHTPRAVPLLNLRERTKDQVLRAQGALLLLSAAGPGLLLLLRRRARQQLQPQKGPSEEENLYEGLTLDTCSMYEDISGGGLQATYQDVGTLPGPPAGPPPAPPDPAGEALRKGGGSRGGGSSAPHPHPPAPLSTSRGGGWLLPPSPQ
ncbi:LOW QUALITY PROTEIN: B-cell antigen receptor complex-associated protein alpha chain, partial [Melanerpes formicivorus]|uniref:LOW QUALITY PROTEIN: B-cell antigen receptor complex-associated protein alpha chain n=1 Tax=Melanerpes formicivorus TaxID=211600 RepID=UPI00358EAC44